MAFNRRELFSGGISAGVGAMLANVKVAAAAAIESGKLYRVHRRAAADQLPRDFHHHHRVANAA